MGTSGWVYKHWNGIFYPKGLASGDQLRFYAKHFKSVEINFSFYRLPERAVFENWHDQTPQGFLFAVKASRYLTHMKKLKEPEEPLGRLMNRADGLKEKLGPILFQFPHNWSINIERLESFLPHLRDYSRQRFAFEFRHQSWLTNEVFRLLDEAGAALCLPIAPGLPVEPRLTAPFTYIRFHGGSKGIGFTKRELALWAGRIESFREKRADVYVYFNNDAEGYALKNAKRLGAMLEGERKQNISKGLQTVV